MNIATIVENIDRRLNDLDGDLAQLHAARAALLNGSAVSPAPKPGQSPRVRPKPRYDVVPVAKLTGQLAETQGLRTRELAQKFNGDPTLVLALLKEQEAAGNLRRSGSRAATRWHVITDEDRIQARAAEIEARGRRGRARKS